MNTNKNPHTDGQYAQIQTQTHTQSYAHICTSRYIDSHTEEYVVSCDLVQNVYIFKTENC